MPFIDISNEPTFVKTKDGIIPIKIKKTEYDKTSGKMIIREYEEVDNGNYQICRSVTNKVE